MGKYLTTNACMHATVAATNAPTGATTAYGETLFFLCRHDFPPAAHETTTKVAEKRSLRRRLPK